MLKKQGGANWQEYMIYSGLLFIISAFFVFLLGILSSIPQETHLDVVFGVTGIITLIVAILMLVVVFVLRIREGQEGKKRKVFP